MFTTIGSEELSAGPANANMDVADLLENALPVQMSDIDHLAESGQRSKTL
jgi:hypothetical protein